MLEELKKEQPMFYQQAILAIQQKKINHAYLLETNHLAEEKVSQIIEFFVFTIIQNSSKSSKKQDQEKLKHLINSRNYPDFIEVKPENNVIRKEQLLTVMHQFEEKSFYDSAQIYIVYEAEKMNTSAANTILKFLEEPQENIIALFVTKNRYRMINTILSRCQVLSLKNTTFNQSLEIEEDVKEIIQDITKRKETPLLVNFKKYSEGLCKDKTIALSNFSNLKDYYKEKLEEETTPDPHLLEIIHILSQAIEKLQYNVNMKLWLDQLLLALTEV